MPRAKAVVMGKLPEGEAYEAAIKKAIKTHEPYKVFKHRDVGEADKDGYFVFYTAPKGGRREIIREEIPTRETANLLRDRLSRAWAIGFWSSGR